jgi:hypothetical protein
VYPELPWADCWSLTPMLCLKIFGSHVQALAPLLSAYPVIYEENTVVKTSFKFIFVFMESRNAEVLSKEHSLVDTYIDS